MWKLFIASCNSWTVILFLVEFVCIFESLKCFSLDFICAMPFYWMLIDCSVLHAVLLWILNWYSYCCYMNKRVVLVLLSKDICAFNRNMLFEVTVVEPNLYQFLCNKYRVLLLYQMCTRTAPNFHHPNHSSISSVNINWPII